MGFPPALRSTRRPRASTTARPQPVRMGTVLGARAVSCHWTGTARNFTRRVAARDDAPMRALVPAFVALSLAACSSAVPPRRPPSSLAARAWAGREPPTTRRAWEAVSFALAQVGRRYCWGGVGPECFDCSGLVQRAWGMVGVRLPRTAGAMASALSEVPLEQVRAGDVLWWPGHVGIYAGNGWMVDALDTRHGVVRRPAAEPHRALRPWGTEGAADIALP
jgi:cell wall-associated NlpC family hydrolase